MRAASDAMILTDCQFPLRYTDFMNSNKKTIVEEPPLQSSLFEEDYLLRALGPVAHIPQVALTELVANAWDAGASKVDIIVPGEIGSTLTIEDNGHGMSADQFQKRWMTLRYDRLKHQGISVEFPAGFQKNSRTAYGRNGVGRHGLLCFSDNYIVETWTHGVLSTFEISTDSGPSPFIIRSKSTSTRKGSGTRLLAVVSRNLPKQKEMLDVLSTRFVHDPEFSVFLNGKMRQYDQLEGKVKDKSIDMANGRCAVVSILDTTRASHSSIHHGIAFWVSNRLVGTPSWSIRENINIDGRTRFARRYKVIVNTSGFEDCVNSDWTGFDVNSATQELFKEAATAIEELAQLIDSEIMDGSTEDALTDNRESLKDLGKGAQNEVANFAAEMASKHPTVSPDFLSSAVNAVINLEKSKSGASLLQRLSSLGTEDVDGLDRLLSEWTVKDALRVLDVIDARLSVVETITRIADDPETDELQTLHPLILRSRWIFGPEYESDEYCSNSTLKTIARELFKSDDAEFINDRNRPDVVVLPDKTTIQITGIEAFDLEEPTISKINHVLVIELKRGGFCLTRSEMNQADGYVQDIAQSGALTKRPYVNAWVVGQKIKAGVASVKKTGDESGSFGQVNAVTFSGLADTANLRLIKLRERLRFRYEGIATNELLDRVLSQPTQMEAAI